MGIEILINKCAYIEMANAIDNVIVFKILLDHDHIKFHDPCILYSGIKFHYSCIRLLTLYTNGKILFNWEFNKLNLHYYV
jgi:hypothetical protein